MPVLLRFSFESPFVFLLLRTHWFSSTNFFKQKVQIPKQEFQTKVSFTMLMSEHGITPLTVGVVIFIFMIGIIFGLMLYNSPVMNEPEEKIYVIIIEIKNVSNIQKTVTTSDGRPVVIAPGETARITIPSNDFLTVNTENLDGSVSKDRLAIAPRKGTDISTVYLGNATISTNLTGLDGKLENHSAQPVQFIELGKDGKRWPYAGPIAPGSSLSAIIPVGSSWQAVSPERENMVLGNVKAVTGTYAIVYDGYDLQTLRS